MHAYVCRDEADARFVMEKDDIEFGESYGGVGGAKFERVSRKCCEAVSR